MIIRQFLIATQDASAGHRADAASALARAYLHGEFGPDAASQAKTALLALLDDPSALVRRSLAEACASSTQTPRPLIVALASDHPDVACLVLARSPVLMDADLVDCAAIGCERARSAIAGRSDLSKPVAAALAEVAGPDALLVLAENFHASIGTASFLRMIERHGDDADLREALLKRDDVGIEVKQTLAACTAASLAEYSQASGWVSPERGARMAREAREAATLSLSDEAGEAGLARLVSHLRKQGELNAGLILRAILTLRMPFAEAALADLSGLSRARVAGLMFEPKAAGFVALHHKAGLPPLLLPVIQAALATWREAATGRSELSGIPLARRMIEHALAVSETLPFAEGRAVMALLARFEAEAAREEARVIAEAAVEDVDDTLLLGQAERIADPTAVEPIWPVIHPSDRLSALPPPAGPEESHTGLPVEAILDQLPMAIMASYHAAQQQQQQQQQRQAEPAEAVLDALSGELMASYRAAQEQRQAAPAEIVPDALSGDLVASILANRVVVGGAIPDPVPATVAPRKAARPREIALVLALSMIPRAEPDRTRLAA